MCVCVCVCEEGNVHKVVTERRKDRCCGSKCVYVCFSVYATECVSVGVSECVLYNTYHTLSEWQ